MPLVGSLRDMSLAELLSVIALGEKSGIITIQADAGSGQIHVLNGRIVQGSDPYRDERFGEILLKLGRITRADLESALETQEHSGGAQRLGTILIDMGKITKADQDAAIVYQTAEAVYDLCTWRVGYFQFDQHLTPEETGVVLPITSVLDEVHRRAKADARARREGVFDEEGGPLHARRALTPDKLELVRLSRAFRKHAEEFDPAAWPSDPPPEQSPLDVGELEEPAKGSGETF